MCIRDRLFNLEDDPKEMNDLAENYPEIVDKLENLMEKVFIYHLLIQRWMPIYKMLSLK